MKENASPLIRYYQNTINMEGEENTVAKKAAIFMARTTATIALLFVLCSTILGVSLLWPRKATINPSVPFNEDAVKVSVATVATKKKALPSKLWSPPSENSLPSGKTGEMIRYGKELLTHTARYFGPNGSVARISNGMNCQNCHLQAGTKLFGNNYAIFISSYPKLGARSGRIDPPSERISECFKRSLNGKMPDTNGKEVQAMLAYMKWLGAGVKKGQKVFGSGSEKLKYLNREADPLKGKLIYMGKCASCHGKTGEGVATADKKEYTYPPLWGPHSYNDGAGLYRLGSFAGFVKNNMPFGTSYPDAQLSDEEAWDVAAFVNSRPRPHKDQRKDYPDLKKKPLDAPFGPYADSFSEKQHKLGPFGPIAANQKSKVQNSHKPEY